LFLLQFSEPVDHPGVDLFEFLGFVAVVYQGFLEDRVGEVVFVQDAVIEIRFGIFVEFFARESFGLVYRFGAAAYAPAGAGTEELFAPTPVPTGTLSRDELLELAKGVAVYYSKTGSKSYHTADCEYKFDAKNAHTLYEAIQDGKGVCGICHPPTLDSLK